MNRYLKVFILTVLVVGLMASTAFAAAIGTDYNSAAVTGGVDNMSVKAVTKIGIAYEAAKLAINDDQQSIFYAPTYNLIAGDFITFTFTNMKANNKYYKLCMDNGTDNGTEISNLTGGGSGDSSLAFRAGAAVKSTKLLYIIGDNASTLNCGYATDDNVSFAVTGGLAVDGVASVSVAASNAAGTALTGTTASADIYIIKNYWKASSPSKKSETIDFAYAMKTFNVGNNIMGLDNITVTVDNSTLAVNPTAANFKFGVTFQGNALNAVKRLCFVDNASANKCTAAASTYGDNMTWSTTTNIATSDNITLRENTGFKTVIEFDNSTVLTAGTYTITVGITPISTNTSGNARTLLAATDYFTLTLNATTFYIPLINASGNGTTIKMQSKNTANGTNGIYIQALCKSGTSGLSTAFQVTGKTSITAGTPVAITSSELTTAAAAATCTVDTTNGYAAIISINAPRSDLFVYANHCDANWSCKRIPVQAKHTDARAAATPDIME